MAVAIDDAHERRRRAFEIQDDLVQGLATAKLQFELGNGEAGMAALDATLAAAKLIATALLDEDAGPGDLRRSSAAQVG